jgi:peptidoglycan/xylan/chitin deacetylase (PgdA/CDA1 family)
VRTGKLTVYVFLCLLILAGCGTSSRRSGLTVGQSARAARPPAMTVAKPSARVRNATPQPGWRRYTGPVPILVYHELGNPPPSEPYPDLYVSDENFKAEMAWLHDHGWQAVTLDEMMNAWFHGGKLPAKPIVVTFDNGYPPQVTFAPKVMARYGWPGVLNEITEDHLHNNQIWHVLRLGWEVDSHSLTHPDMAELDAAQMRDQLVGSRHFLRHTFHVPVNSFCYPSSEYTPAVVNAVKAAGYTNAVTENPGYATSADPYLLNRFEITGDVTQLADDLGSGPPATASPAPESSPTR